MNSHPITFSDWSIPRILARQKTQTRRVIWSQPEAFNGGVYPGCEKLGMPPGRAIHPAPYIDS